MTNQQSHLVHLIKMADNELTTAEEILNDGVDYGQDFYNDLHDHMRDVIKTAARVKGILVKRYGVVAI